jgi:hypothetical protein
MTPVLDPFRFVLIAFSGWMNGRQLLLIDYLREENRVLREQLGDKRLRFTDDQRRRSAAKAKRLGRKVLVELATIVTLETLLAWYRRLIAQKYDGSKNPDNRGRRRRWRRLSCACRRRIAVGAIAESRVLWPIWGMTSVAAPSLSPRAEGN